MLRKPFYKVLLHLTLHYGLLSTTVHFELLCNGCLGFRCVGCSNIVLLLMDIQSVSAFMFIANDAKMNIPVYISSVFPQARGSEVESVAPNMAPGFSAHSCFISLLPHTWITAATVRSCYSLAPRPQWVSRESLPWALTRLALALFSHSSTTSLLRDVPRKLLPQALCTLSSLTWECSFSRYSHGFVSSII